MNCMKKAIAALLLAAAVAGAVIYSQRVSNDRGVPLPEAAARHAVCAERLVALGQLLLRYGREQGRAFPGGGPSGIAAFQQCAERYAHEVNTESFTCPLAGGELPTRLPNGVLRIMHPVTSYRVRAADVPWNELTAATLLLFEARSMDGQGRWVLFGDFKARWLDEETFKRRAREQNLYGLPPELVK